MNAISPSCVDQPLGELVHLQVLTVLQHHFGHVDRTLVMGNHAAHEVDVGISAKCDVHILMHLRIGGSIGGRGCANSLYVNDGIMMGVLGADGGPKTVSACSGLHSRILHSAA